MPIGELITKLFSSTPYQYSNPKKSLIKYTMNADAANKADIVGGSDVDDDGRRATGTTGCSSSGATCNSSCSPSPSNDVYKWFFKYVDRS